MENKLYSKDCITLDGRMDEAVWETAKEYTDFRRLEAVGGEIVPIQTSFKFICCEDRVYLGVKCMEPEIEHTIKIHPLRPLWETDSIEFFISPSGTTFDFYQFVVTFGGNTYSQYYSEGGQITPDRYAPNWNHAIFVGEDHWSMEVELPLTAFYMTSNDRWSTDWLFNMVRNRVDGKRKNETMHSSWQLLQTQFREPENFGVISGFPMRAAADDLRIVEAMVEISDKNEKGYCGSITVKTLNPEAAEFVFSSDCTEEIPVTLQAGANEFTVPCCFTQSGRTKIILQLKRKSDGVIFKRYYPVRISYEAIKLNLTLPEYRSNFYPGQDYSRIVGKVIANKPVTLTLEGPGIEKKTITPDADGSFCFETPDFEVGAAFLTVFNGEETLSRKIRRLAPTGRQMSWISGGNLIINGEPVLRRNMYAQYYRGGEAFKRRYDADDLHITKEICGQRPDMQPDYVLKRNGMSVAEVTADGMPGSIILEHMDKVIEANKDRDFTYYYLSDEPDCRELSPIYLKNLYEYIADKDPYHVVLIGTRGAGTYVECADWFETHPYINPQVLEDGTRFCERPINTLGKFVDDIAKLNRPDKCIGFLPTCFAYTWSNKYSDYPTLDEYICHTWAAMIRGGKTLWPYAYHDLNDRASLYEGTRYVFSSFEALDKLVMLGKRTVLTKSMETEAVLYDKGDEQMFVLVNMTAEAQKVTLDGLTGQWHNFRHGGTITGNSFQLKPFEVVIGTSRVKDEGLPTYQETTALVDKLEYARTHTGSLLFDHHLDIPITSSVSGSIIKLFDGVKDNLAWNQSGQKEKFMELDLTKVKPTFSKVVISGYHVDDMAIKVGASGALAAPAIAEVKTEEFATTFVLSEPVCPDVLRLEFYGDTVELYEIEVF